MPPLSPLPFHEVKRRLEGLGFTVVGQKGSHAKFARQTADGLVTAIVPRKREIPVGTLRSILNQAHVNPEDFISLRET